MPRTFTVPRGVIRAATGLLLTAGVVVTVTALSTRLMPEVTRPVPSFTVDTAGSTHDTLVCPGSFAVLGVNPNSPNDAVGAGKATVTVSDTDATATALEQEFPGEQAATSYTVTSDESLTGAQVQQLKEETATGLAAVACQEPMNDQWLVGGTTERGTSNVITLSNPGSVPATVTITVYDEEGIVENVGTSGVLVPPQTQSTLPLAGFGVGRVSPVIHVQAAGSPVAATLGVHAVRDIQAIGADTVNAQYAPDTSHVFPGVHHRIDTAHSDAGDAGADVPVIVRLMAPGADTDATLTGLTDEGKPVELGKIELTADTVTDTALHSVPDKVTAIHVTSDEPVIGGVRSDVLHTGANDFTWMAPATRFEADEQANAIVHKGGKLTLVNLSDGGAEFKVGDKTVKLDGGATWQGATPARVTLSGEQPFAAAVTLSSDTTLANYPVLEETAELEELTVYTR